MQKILGAKLGGVDRSSVAVIGASTLAGSSTRPTMAYFGATDGMLHAVCASKVTSGACAGHTGMELWAFIPRVQLPLLRTNSARIDGSPHVIDAFGDFDADGSSGWSTILIFQTGYGTSATPATYALDVTDPEDPHLVWEKTAAASPSSFELGTGLTVAAGRVGNTLENVAVVVTTNGGSGGAGVVATAISLESGATKWQFGWLYPSAPRNVSADGPLPATAIPGGAVAVDIGGLSRITDFVFGDIYGNLWRLDASTGISRNGASTPLFSFSTNKHPIGSPPAIYSNGSQQYAVFASGGYTDHGGSAAWRSPTQYVIATTLDSTSLTSANDTATTCSTCAVSFKVTTTGQYAFSQALVVGSQLFVTTDSGDVNASSYGSTANSGTVRTVELATQTSTTAVVSSGGSALAASGTTLVSSSGQKQQQTATATGTTGTSVDIFAAITVSRLLYLRLD
jgi:type IV pilus assembly protein PilY1